MSILALGFLLGATLGAAARWSELCSLTAIADVFYKGDTRMARAWLLALLVALVGTQGLALAGAVDLSRSFYLGASLSLPATALGGLLFGFGMAIVGTCAFGSLVRAGSGDLRALLDALVIGIFAYATVSGMLSGSRLFLLRETETILAVPSQGLPDLLAPLGLSTGLTRGLAIALGLGAIAWLVAHRGRGRRSRRQLIAGPVMGGVVVLAWWTTGVVGADPFDPEPLRAMSFVRPLGDALMVILFGETGAGFSVATVVGVLVGSAAISRHLREFHVESFDSNRQTLRHLLGAALMGAGGILALGCTIGQGLSAASTLALSAPIAIAAIWAGAWLGLHYLEKGSVRGLVGAALGRRPPP